MSLSDVEFSVLRFATDAIIGEPARYDRILRVAEKEFPDSKSFRQAIGYLRNELKTADLSTARSAERQLKQIATKLLETSTTGDETRQLAGSALMASLDMPLVVDVVDGRDRPARALSRSSLATGSRRR